MHPNDHVNRVQSSIDVIATAIHVANRLAAGALLAALKELEEGLAAARAVTPDAIILDIRMPGRSGLEGLPEFKEAHPDTPVIMITAFHDMDTTVQAMKRGADDYIDKPIDINELDAAVAKSLARSKTVGDEIRLPLTRLTDANRERLQVVLKEIGLV